MSLQLTMNFKKHIWSCPSEYKDLSGAKEIAIDVFDVWIDKLKQANPEIYDFFKSHSFFTQSVISNIANFIERHSKFIKGGEFRYIIFKDRDSLDESLQELVEDLMGDSGNETC